jgi:very-short-patch-repair endonuclease
VADYSRDRAVTRIAGGQRNLVSAAQLLECGLGKDAVARRVRAGWLRLVFQGVYSVGSGELPSLALEFGALLSCGKGSLVSHRSAAFVWGMRKTGPGLVEVSVVGCGCRLRKGMRVHRVKAVDERELWREQGLWVSSPARAVLEVAAVGARDELIDVIDAGLALRRFSPRELKVVLERNRGRRGAGRLAEVLGDETAMAISRSRAEKAFLRLIRDARLPMPDTNVKFGRFEADFVWREQRLIVELDSATYHSGPGVFQRDREKDLVFRGAGFDVMRPTRAHVVHEGPRVLVLLVQALVRRREAA